MSENALQRLFSAALSNYTAFILRMILMLFLTRILFLGLTPEAYGFWALLWSIFAYSLLFDFGYGTTLMKSTSEVCVQHNWLHYNKLLNTILINYLFIGLLIVMTTLLFSWQLPKWGNISTADDPHNYRQVLLIFGCGTGLVFPLGVFTEILRGLQKYHLRNVLLTLRELLNFFGMLYAIRQDSPLLAMAVVAISSQFICNLAMAIVCLKAMPKLSLSPRFYSWKVNRAATKFSLLAYVITLGSLLSYKSDQIVISVFSTFALVAFYHVAIRWSEIYRLLASQLQDILAPMAAAMNSHGSINKSQQLMIFSNKIVAAIATATVIPIAFFAEPLLLIWLKIDNQETLFCSYILLFCSWFTVVFRHTSGQILLVSEHQRSLALIAALECSSNLLLSIYLIQKIGIIGVALGTMIPSLLLGLFINTPLASRFCTLSIGRYLARSFLAAVISGVISITLLLLLINIFSPQQLLALTFSGGLIFISYLTIFYYIGFNHHERSNAHRLCRSYYRKFSTGISKKIQRK